jgi:hypothetical protein
MASVLIYVNKSEVFFYSVGIFELAMIIVIWVLSIVEPRVRSSREALEEEDDE